MVKFNNDISLQEGASDEVIKSNKMSIFSDKLTKVVSVFLMGAELDPAEFEGLGMKNSREYYAKLVRLMAAHKLTKTGKCNGGEE